jgi:hypothetical protein
MTLIPQNTLIEVFYDVSNTDRKICPENTAAIHRIATVAHEKGIDERHMENITFFVNLLGVETDLSGLGLIGQQLNLLIKQCCCEAMLSHKYITELIDSIDIMRKLMSDHILKKEIKFNRLVREYKSTTPVFAFHVSGVAGAGALRPNYEKFALHINRLLRDIEREVPERLEESARIMRYFIESPRNQRGHLRKEILKSALRETSAVKKWKPATLKQYEDFVDKMYGVLEPPIPRGGGYTRNAHGTRVHFEDISVVEDEDEEKKRSGNGVKINKRFALPKEAAREGECIDDYFEEEVILTIPSPFLNTEIHSHSALPLSILSADTHQFFWDRWSLKLYEISLLFYYLLDVCDSTVTRAFLESSLFLGIKLDDMLDIIIGRAVSSKETTSNKNKGEVCTRIQLFFSPERGTISYVIPETSLGYVKETLVSRNCLNSGIVVELRLPESFNNSFCELVKSFNRQKSGANLLFPHDVRACCYAEIKRFIASLNAQFELSISRESLARSFKSYYQSRYGCDPILVSYSSASLDTSTRTQRFYSCVAPQVLHEEYYRCYRMFKNDIYNNLKEISKINDAIVPVRSLEYLEVRDEVPSSDDLNDFTNIGSKVVPNKKALKEFFEKVETMLESCLPSSLEHRCDYHNLYTIYAYIVIQLGTALRPVADPPIDLDSVDFTNKFIFLSDKDSKNYQEGRIIYAPLIVTEILKQLAEGGRHTMELLRSFNSRNAKDHNRLFYVISPDFKASKVTPELIRAVLNRHGFLELYDYPLNCLRHLLRSELPRRGVSSDLVDALMGHVRDGKELLNMYSTGSMEPLRLVARIVGDLMDELGIRAIKYYV